MTPVLSSPLFITLSVWLLAGSLLAQGSNDDKSNVSTGPANELAGTRVDHQGPPMTDKIGPQPPRYISSIDGAGLIALSNSVNRHVLFGGNLAGGWDSNPDNAGNSVPTSVYILSPYLEIQGETPKIQYNVQYQPTITGSGSGIYSRRTLNLASVAVVGALSERSSVDIRGTGSYGEDSIRLLEPQQTISIGAVPGVDPNSASYLPNVGKITVADEEVGLSYRESERDSFAVRVTNTFSRYSGVSKASSIATTKLTYGREVSPILGLIAYGQVSQYYGSLHCSAFGAGVGFQWQPNANTLVSLSGGPHLDSSACTHQQGFSYDAALSKTLHGDAQVYLLATRQLTTPYLGPGLWAVNTSGGFQRRIASRGTVKLEAGYVTSETLTTTTSYSETYLSCSYSQNLRSGVSASLSYRGYVGHTGPSTFDRNVVLFSIAWTPNLSRTHQ